jgi:hypothetical protein
VPTPCPCNDKTHGDPEKWVDKLPDYATTDDELANEATKRSLADEKLTTALKQEETERIAADKNAIESISATQEGITYIKGDGSINTVSISGVNVTVNTASKTVKGIVQVGDNINVSSTGVISTDKATLGLDKVENSSSTDILAKITSDNVTTALGYTPASPIDLSAKVDKSTNQDVSGVLNFTNGIKINGVAVSYDATKNEVTFG